MGVGREVGREGGRGGTHNRNPQGFFIGLGNSRKKILRGKFLRFFNALLYLEKGVVAALRAFFLAFSILGELPMSGTGKIPSKESTDFLRSKGSFDLYYLNF